MSVFRTLNIPCPACGGETPFNLVHSVNADRRADLRDEILAATFQQMPCPGCGKEFRVEPEFNYLNLGRNQWIAAWPRASMAEWREYDTQARESFDDAFGENAPPGAQEMGRNIVPRITFGWAALREKLFVRDAGLDDVTVELAKAALIRASPTARAMTSELRLLAIEGEELVFGWIDSNNEKGIEINRVNRALLAEIEADQTTWEALRTQLSAELFVDINRLFLPQSEEREEEETTKSSAGKKKKGAAGKSSGKKSSSKGKAASSKKKKK
jgi:hypothetical protein